MTTSLVNNKLAKDIFFEAGSSLSLSIGQYFEGFLKKDAKSLNIITCSVFDAIRIKEEIAWFFPKLKVNLLPDWETLPYDNFSPHQDIVSQRLLTLYQLPRLKQGIVLISVSTLLLKLPPREYIEQNSLVMHTGQELDMHEVRSLFEQHGYNAVNQVYSHGEFAVRGSILDVFPMGSDKPLRIDFFDDEIDTIRYFDPESQLSEDTLNNFELLPAKEFPLDKDGIEAFRQNFRRTFDVNLQKVWLYL